MTHTLPLFLSLCSCLTHSEALCSCSFFVASVHSRAEQQGAFLEQRQAEFKQAALHAKSSGDLELAKKYLRMAKVPFHSVFLHIKLFSVPNIGARAPKLDVNLCFCVVAGFV